MKSFRLRRIALAIAIASTAPILSGSLIAAEPASADKSILELSSTQTFEKIRNDVVSGQYSSNDILVRIDELVADIDAKLSAGQGDPVQLIKVRNASLRVRGEVVRFAEKNGTTLVQLAPAPMPIGGDPMQGMSDQPLVGNIISDNVVSERIVDAPLGATASTPNGAITTGPITGGYASGGSYAGGGSFSGGSFSGGAGGGFSGGGGAAGGARYGLLAAGVATAIAVPLSVNDDNNNEAPGNVGSQSED